MTAMIFYSDYDSDINDNTPTDNDNNNNNSDNNTVTNAANYKIFNTVVNSDHSYRCVIFSLF